MKIINLFIILIFMFVLCACSSAGVSDDTARHTNSSNETLASQAAPHTVSQGHQPENADRFLTPIPSPRPISQDDINSIYKYEVFKLLADFSSSKYQLPAYKPEDFSDGDASEEYHSYVQTPDSFSYSYKLYVGMHNAIESAYFIVDNYALDNPTFFEFSTDYLDFCAKQFVDSAHYGEVGQFINTSIDKITKHPLKAVRFETSIEDVNFAIDYTADTHSEEFYGYIELWVG